MRGFGPHLGLDGHGCEQDQPEDMDHIDRVLDEPPVRTGMTKITPPCVLESTGVRPENRGSSGFALLAESPIPIHTFPEKPHLSLDILSCKPAAPRARGPRPPRTAATRT